MVSGTLGSESVHTSTYQLPRHEAGVAGFGSDRPSAGRDPVYERAGTPITYDYVHADYLYLIAVIWGTASSSVSVEWLGGRRRLDGEDGWILLFTIFV